MISIQKILKFLSIDYCLCKRKMIFIIINLKNLLLFNIETEINLNNRT